MGQDIENQLEEIRKRAEIKQIGAWLSRGDNQAMFRLCFDRARNWMNEKGSVGAFLGSMSAIAGLSGAENAKFMNEYLTVMIGTM